MKSYSCITAKYKGECSHCGERLEVGDNIAYSSDEIICSFCAQCAEEDDEIELMGDWE